MCTDDIGKCRRRIPCTDDIGKYRKQAGRRMECTDDIGSYRRRANAQARATDDFAPFAGRSLPKLTQAFLLFASLSISIFATILLAFR